jgi:hypothetical protein
MEDVVNPDTLREAIKLIRQGGECFVQGIAMLLISKAEIEEKGITGTKTGELQRGLRMLDSDPYLTLGLNFSKRVLDTEIKKKWRSLALKYHPDKTQNRTTPLFALIQQAYSLLSDPVSKATFDAKFRRVHEVNICAIFCLFRCFRYTLSFNSIQDYDIFFCFCFLSLYNLFSIYDVFL